MSARLLSEYEVPDEFEDGEYVVFKKRDAKIIFAFNSFRHWGRVGWALIGNKLLPYHRVAKGEPWRIVRNAIPDEEEYKKIRIIPRVHSWDIEIGGWTV